jgi:hypothetical protein
MMKKIVIKSVLLFGWALCVPALFAQTGKDPRKDLVMPELFSPESAVNRSSMGIIRSDIDGFMAVDSFKGTEFTSNLFYLGLEPQGATIGYGQKLGVLYFGLAYGGSLIQDLISRATNQDADDYVVNIVSNGDDDTPTVTQRGEENMLNHSKNEFNIFLGLWRFGLKIGFSQVLDAEQPGLIGNSYNGAFENSMVPSIELGMSIPLGKEKTMYLTPALLANVDIHQFISGSAQSNSAGTNILLYEKYQTNYIETKGGISLAFTKKLQDKEKRDNGEFEIGGSYSLVKRMDKFSLSFDNGSTIRHEINDYEHGWEGVITTTVDNLEQRIDPYLLFSTTTDEAGKFKMGAKIKADISVNDKYYTPDNALAIYGDTKSHEEVTSVKPEIDIGASFAFMPKRLAVHAGFGLNLWQFTMSEDNMQVALPSTKFAVGFTANLTANTTIDMLLITSGKFDFLSNDPKNVDKFTLFITRKK